MANQKEIWRDIEGYEGLYQVSNLGRVKSLSNNRTRKEKILSLTNHHCNYLNVSLSKDGANKKFFVHRLVAMAFIPNPDNKPQVNHINGIKTDNYVENLEWCTPKENSQHAFNTKLAKGIAGQDNYRAKLTNEQAKKIRKECIPNDKEHGQNALARKYGVSPTVIHFIIHNKSYK